MKDVHKEHFFKILKKYRLGKASAEEVKFLEAYYNIYEINEDLSEAEQNGIKERVKSRVDQEVAAHEKALKGRRFSVLVQRYAAAAVVLLTLSIGTYFISKRFSTANIQLAARHDVAPGGNKAILTLANGKKIILDEVVNGDIVKEPGIRITKTSDGQIVYTVVAEEGVTNNLANNLLNTISTPKGGQYQVVLPDGTRVWLNSASSLKYPATFTAEKRVVELSGEAYFEVAKVFVNKEQGLRMPFIVKTDKQEVEVLGTHFNINAYNDEPVMKTTLLEGSVNVVADAGQSFNPIGKVGLTLVPGEQARVYRSGAAMSVEKNINLDKEVAWKNGIFSFDNDDLKTVMRQIARWYNVNVVYSGTIPEEKFFGEISRNSNLSQVFKILELNNVHFDVQGKTVSVSANDPGISKNTPK